MVYLLKVRTEAKLIVTLRTHALVEQFADRLAAHTGRFELQTLVARVGWDKERELEHFQQTISAGAQSQCGQHLPLQTKPS